MKGNDSDQLACLSKDSNQLARLLKDSNQLARLSKDSSQLARLSSSSSVLTNYLYEKAYNKKKDEFMDLCNCFTCE